MRKKFSTLLVRRLESKFVGKKKKKQKNWNQIYQNREKCRKIDEIEKIEETNRK